MYASHCSTVSQVRHQHLPVLHRHCDECVHNEGDGDDDDQNAREMVDCACIVNLLLVKKLLATLVTLIKRQVAVLPVSSVALP